MRTSTLRAVTKCRVAVAQGDQLDRTVLEQISQGHRREQSSGVRLLFCGVRGSTPAPGAEFVRVGGHTSCVALAHDGEPWSLLLDAGTGIRRVTDHLDGDAFDGALAADALHWDHVQGLPFFAAGDRDDSRVRVFMPDQGGADARPTCSRAAMSPPHFPIGPDGLRGDWCFEASTPGRHRDRGLRRSTAFDVPHKGGRTFGFRVDATRRRVDRVHPRSSSRSPRRTPRSRACCAGVDLLVHDAQFLGAEQAVADLYGHATIDDALALAAALRRPHAWRCSTTRPARTDDDVDAIGAGAATAAREGVEVIVAREEAVIELGGGSP